MAMGSKDKLIRNKDTGSFITRYVKSFFHAIDGIVYSLKHEHNMVIMFMAVIVVTIAGFVFNISAYEWLFCITVFGLVIGCELLNSSIEAVVDLSSPQMHPLAKIAKDAASGASLVFSLTAFVGALIIFVPKIF